MLLDDTCETGIYSRQISNTDLIAKFNNRNLFLISGLLLSLIVRKYASIQLIAFLTVAFLSQGCYAQDSAGRFLHWLKDDPVTMFTDIGPQQLYTMASLGVGVTAISMGDRASSIYFQREYGGSRMLNFTNSWGDWKIAGAASAGIFATSLITRNSKFQDAAFTSMQALLMTNLSVNAAKFVFGRQRPIHQDGPYDFDFAELGANSFPSGHTATAFALITPWVIYYPGPVTYALMAIPVGTAIARVAKGRHWMSDVSAGAAIGFSIGHYLAKKHLNLRSNNVQFIPSAGVDNLSLTLNVSF